MMTDMPTILFGAFDRHNFGDLLFPHIAAALLQDEQLLYAGLAGRDLCEYDGHRTRPIMELRDCEANIIHAGGELLTCSAWQAAIMLLPACQANAIIARLDARPREKMEWAHHMLGTHSLTPYSLPKQLFPRATSIVYNAVGGANLGECDPALRAEALAKLAAAEGVSVRDRCTQATLNAAGIDAALMPDPAVLVKELFGATIHRRAAKGEAARMLGAFPQGYVCVQFSADFGDDETLAAIADQLDRIAHSSGHGVVMFRAGAAPWHDDLDCYRRVAARMHAPAGIFNSLRLWDICALIASSRAYIGSSLHGRIVATAFGLPRTNLRHPAHIGHLTKQAAYAATWEAQGMPAVVDVDGISRGLGEALAADRAQLSHIAAALVGQYRHGFDSLRARMKSEPSGK
jgi:hypothetical protein